MNFSIGFFMEGGVGWHSWQRRHIAPYGPEGKHGSQLHANDGASVRRHVRVGSTDSGDDLAGPAPTPAWQLVLTSCALACSGRYRDVFIRLSSWIACSCLFRLVRRR